jgi:predicted lipoprotein with Yx(FWY)xxD motif
MRLSILLTPLAIGTVAVGLAACGSNGDAPAASTTGTSAGIVSVASVGGTDVLAGAGGKTLYEAPVEKGGRIKCVDACTSFWEPLLASPAAAKKAAEAVGAKLDVAKRPDGRQQLTLDGLPLYTFTQEGSGKLEGDGFVDDFQGTHFEWQAARTSGGGSQPSNSSDSGPGGGYGY